MSNSPSAATAGTTANPESIPPIQPSKKLLVLAQNYLEIVDSGDEARQRDERTEAHEALMDAMQAEGIPFNARWEARWIGRWLLSANSVGAGKHTTIMFAQVPRRYDAGEYDPIRDGVLQLTSTPFANESEERQNALRYIPVVVTIEPLHNFDDATYERNQ